MALLFTTGGHVIDVAPGNGSDFSLEELQGFVGGYIEIIGAGHPVSMCVNENGKAECAPNPLATFAAMSFGLIAGDVIHGNALLYHSGEVK